MKSLTTILLVLALVIHHTWGVFDGRNPGTGPRPGDQFPVTGTLLQCAGDEPGRALMVGLSVTNPGDVFRPLTSPYGHNYYYIAISLHIHACSHYTYIHVFTFVRVKIIYIAIA